jgi:hypothetical protein
MRSRARSAHLFKHMVKLALFVAAGAMAVRYFVGTLLAEGWTPQAFFALLVLTGAVSLVWRSALDVAKVARRLKP